MNELFKEALSDFTFDAAAGRAICHLHDLGYDAEKIQKELDFPVSIERITEKIKEYESEKKKTEEGDYKIIKEQGKYGKVTFRKVKV